MNFVGHVEVARTLFGHRADDDLLAFGAALPDLTSMAHLRLDQSALLPVLREGVNLHHRTDRVFHALGGFSGGVRAITAELSARGLSAGAARAVGHAGFELLLDGCLLTEPGVEGSFLAALEQAPTAAGAIHGVEAERWRLLVDGMRHDRWWLGYGDAAVVAGALERRLRHRARLAFPAEEIGVVADVLAARLPVVAAMAGELVEQVVAGVRAEVTGGGDL